MDSPRERYEALERDCRRMERIPRYEEVAAIFTAKDDSTEAICKALDSHPAFIIESIEQLKTWLADRDSKIEEMERTIKQAKNTFDEISAQAGGMYKDLERLRNL
jgi:hypothetical protein